MAMLTMFDIQQLMEANKKMEAARATYEEAVEAVNSAANELATKWEGDGQQAFVRDQASAYKWHKSLLQIALQAIQTVAKIAQNYRQAIDALKSKI